MLMCDNNNLACVQNFLSIELSIVKLFMAVKHYNSDVASKTF